MAVPNITYTIRIQNPRMFMLWCLHGSYLTSTPVVISGLLWMPMRCFLSPHIKGKWRNQDTLWFRKWAPEISTNRRASQLNELIHVTYLYVSDMYVEVMVRKIKVILMCVDMYSNKYMYEKLLFSFVILIRGQIDNSA